VRRRLAVVAGVATLALPGAGCADDGGLGGETLTVYVSGPLQGPRAAEGRAVAEGAELALADAGGRIGPLRVRAIYLDDSENGGWSLARSASNARRAAEDTTAIGYIGDLDSGATRVSLPITNQAQIAHVSPGSTAVDLTRLPPAGNADPDQYRPGDEDTFARVVPDDEVQAAAAARWASRMGARQVGIAAASSPFGQVLSQGFLEEAARLGLGTGEGTGVDLVYYAGEADPDRFAAAMRGIPSRPVIGSDALVNPAFLRSAAVSAEALFVTSPYLDPSLLPPAGKRFARRYRQRFGHQPNPAAAYGYEAMALLLDAIRRAGDDGDERGAVADALLSTQNRRSVLGTYSIDGNGDTTLEAVSGYRISDGLPVFPVELQPGR
jgi:branched-chain amino acid transport system substrate-binding protein